MPLVERIITEEVATTKGVLKTPTTLYVAPKDVQKNDRVIPVDEIPDAQLEDLRAAFPVEYPSGPGAPKTAPPKRKRGK